MIEDITDRPIWVDLKGKDPHPLGLSEDAGDNDSYKRRCCCSYGVARYYVYIYIHMFWMGFLMRECKCTCWNQFRLYFPGGFSYSGSVSPSTQRETGRTQCLRQYITLLFTLIRAANGGFSRRFWHLWVEIVFTVCQESGGKAPIILRSMGFQFVGVLPEKGQRHPSWTDSCRSQVPRSPVVWCRDCCACKGTKGAGKLDISGRYTACTVPPRTRPLGAAWVGCCPYKAIDVSHWQVRFWSFWKQNCQ